MATHKLFKVLVLGAMTLGACGGPQKIPDGSNPENDETGQELTVDAGVLVADASEPVPDAGAVEETPDAGDEDPNLCMWAGMDPCPC